MWALEAWAGQAAGGFSVRAASEREAVVRVYWPAPGDQLFGEMRPLVVNGRRGAAVYVTTDMLALGRTSPRGHDRIRSGATPSST